VAARPPPLATEQKLPVVAPRPTVKVAAELRKAAEPRPPAKSAPLSLAPGPTTRADEQTTPVAPNSDARNAPRPSEPVALLPTATTTVVTASPAIVPPAHAASSPPEPRQPAIEPPKPPADPKAAFEYWKSRAASGDAEAYFRTGEMYAAGLGIEKVDNKNAYIRFAMAARAGYTGARSRQDDVARKLQPAEIRAADDYVEKVGRARK
jgi:TPR repeat protein